MDSKRLYERSRELGREVMRLSKKKKTYGSFFIPKNNKEIMMYLPHFQISLLGVPMKYKKEIGYWDRHEASELNKVKEYELALIFRHKRGKENNFFLQEAKEYGKHKHYLIIETKHDSNIRDMLLIFNCGFMKDNPNL